LLDPLLTLCLTLYQIRPIFHRNRSQGGVAGVRHNTDKVS